MTFSTTRLSLLSIGLCFLARTVVSQVELPDLDYDMDALEPYISEEVSCVRAMCVYYSAIP